MGRTADGPGRARRRPPAVQLGFLWGAAAGLAAALVFLAPGVVARAQAALPPCPVKAVAGVPCPACGSGRALVALARLDPGRAVRLNPVFALGAFAFLAGGVAAFGLALAGRGVPEPSSLPLAARAFAVLAFAASWAWLVIDGR